MSDKNDEFFVPHAYMQSDPVIRWSAQQGTVVGDLDAVEATVPCTMNVRLDFWKVPKNEAWPDGYFVGQNTGEYYSAVEPGCASWEKTELIRIHISGDPRKGHIYEDKDNREGKGNGGGQNNYVEKEHPEIHLGIDLDALNPPVVELLNFAAPSDLTGTANSIVMWNGVWGPSDTELDHATTVNVTPHGCSISGIKNHPTLLVDGETYQFSVQQASEANAQFANAQIHLTDAAGSIDVVMSPGLKKTVNVTITQ